MAEANQNPADQTGPQSSPAPSPEAQGKAEEYLDQVAENQAEFSDENIDDFLKIQDPDFAGQLREMSHDKDLHMAESEIDADTAALHDEIEKWRNAKGLKRSLYLVMPFLPRISLAIKKFWFRLFATLRAFRVRAQNFLYDLATAGRRQAQSKIIEFLKWSKDSLIGFFTDFKLLSWKLKLAWAGLLILFVGGIFLIYMAWKGQLIPGDKELFVTSLANQASEVFEVDEAEGFERFYDNVRSTPNLLMIQKIVVNIRSSENSGHNPMAAMELFVEGLNPEVVIEVKDRESFFRDLIQRSTEEFTFDELSSTEGKQRYLQSLLKDLNRNLTTGELRNVRFKTMILKP